MAPFTLSSVPLPHQVSHVNQQVDGCPDGHSQSLVPEAHVIVEPIDAAHITVAVGLSARLLIELVERPEDQRADIEEDREQAEHKLKNGIQAGQPALPFAQVQQDAQGCWDEADGLRGHTALQGRLTRYREVLMMQVKMKPAIKVSSTFSRPGMVSTQQEVSLNP